MGGGEDFYFLIDYLLICYPKKVNVMSVLMEYSMFPTDKGESVSAYVSRITAYLRSRKASYQLTAMGTLVETSGMAEALDIIGQSYKLLAPDCNRVYATVSFDIQKGKLNRLVTKVESIGKRIGKV